MQSAVFYPMNLLLTPLPFARTFAWSALLRLWIAGFSAYLLARFHRVSPTGALVAGVSFMLCGYLIVWLGHPHTNAAVWLPALVLAGEQLLHAEDGARRLRAVALLAAPVGVQLTGGHIETAVDVLFCLGLYYGLRWCQVVPRRGVLVVLPALAVALGAALAAAQLLPFLEWLPLSAEYVRRPPAAVTLFDPRCWRELLALPLALFPNLYGNPTWPGPYRSYLPWGNYSENVLYVGTVPLLCALVALRFRREPGSPVRALAVLVLIAAGMAFRLPVLDWLNALPGLARANPARLRLVTSFGLAMLAGFGVEAVLDGGPAARRWFLGLAAAVVAAGVLVAAAGNLLLPLLVPRLAAWGRHVVVARYAALPAPTHSLDYFYAELDAVLAGMPRAFRIGNLAMYAPAVVAVGGWLAAWGSARGPILVVLAAAELVGLGRGYTPAVPLRDFYPTTPAVSRLAGDRTLHRVTALGETLVPDAHMMYGLADVRGLDFPTRWYAAYLDAAGRLPWIAYGTLVGSADSPLLRVLNVKYVVAADERGGVTLAELAHVQPRCFVVHEAVAAESDAHALALLRSAPGAGYSRVVIGR